MHERTQVMDTIFLKYNLKQFDLTRAVALYELETDGDVIALRTFLQQARKERQMANASDELSPMHE